jgi:hypothetical protein
MSNMDPKSGDLIERERTCHRHPAEASVALAQDLKAASRGRSPTGDSAPSRNSAPEMSRLLHLMTCWPLQGSPLFALKCSWVQN